ncbi:MAG: arylesterase [Pseudomonadota bacterium]
MISGYSRRYGAAAWLRKALISAFTGLMAISGVASAAPVTIVALGDSLTHGFGLPLNDGFVPQLERWLQANGAPEATVINAGVSGDTTAGGLERFDWSVAGGGDAVIVELGGNDLLRAIPPEASRANLDGILTKAGEKGLPVLLTGMSAPLNYGPDYKEAFDSMYPDLAEKHGAIYDPYFLEGMTDPPDPKLFQSDGIHPNKDGVTKIVARFGPLVLDLIARVEAAQ